MFFSANGRWATIDEVEDIRDEVAANAVIVEANKDIAVASANAAVTSYDNFDDRYLGQKTADPSVDNDGGLLLTGALYFRTSGTPIMRVYNGTTWQDVGSITSTTTNLIDPTLYSSQAEAESGVNNTKVMTPLRVKESIKSSRWDTGEWIFTIKTTAPIGTVEPNGGTIGNASSGATTRANSDTYDLFALLWVNTNNTDYPIRDSAGALSVRGASALADFTANKRLPLPNLQNGDALIAAVSSAVLTRTAGENLAHIHTGTTSTDGRHSHAYTFNSDTFAAAAGSYRAQVLNGFSLVNTENAGAHSHNFTTANSGGTKNLAAGLMTKIYIAL